MPISTILIVILVIALISTLPGWEYSANWGLMPSGALGLILIVVIVLIIFGRI